MLLLVIECFFFGIKNHFSFFSEFLKQLNFYLKHQNYFINKYPTKYQ